MGLFIGNESAVRYWLTKAGDECVPEVAPDLSLAQAEINSGLIKSQTLSFEHTKADPLHLLVAERGLCRALSGATAHVWSGPVPPGSFYLLSGSTRIASPELTFLLMAGHLELKETIELGCYLCGAFSIDDKGYGYTGKRQPLTTPEVIGAFLDKVPHAYGMARARRALRYVVANTASPMEVLLGMEYALPVKMGGWALPHIVANQRIDVRPELRRLAGASYFVGDIFIPGIMSNSEYDSAEFHTGKYRLDHTQTRRNVLEAMEVKTVSATYNQIRTADIFDDYMWMVEERFDLSHREFTLEQKMVQHDLHDFLIAHTRKRF
jgi:hypothetical protein